MKRCLTYEVSLLAEVFQPLQLVRRQLVLRLCRRLLQSLLPSEHPVRSRVDDGKLQEVQSRPLMHHGRKKHCHVMTTHVSVCSGSRRILR